MAVSGLSPIDRRARGHAAACRSLLGTTEGIDHRAAVHRHARFVGEVLLELAGHRHELLVGDPGVGRSRQPGTAAGAAGREGHGILYVSLHRGNWIVGARALGDSDDPLHTVAGDQLGARLSPLVARWLGRRGVHLHRAGGSWGALQGALVRGGRVLLHLDGDPFAPGAGRFHRRGVPLGVRSAALLAARACPRVVWVVCERRSQGFHVGAEELGPPASARRSGSPVGWEELLLARLRAAVAGDPEGWLIFRSEHLGEPPA